MISSHQDVAVWALATAFGLRFAAEWGIFGFTLNYIPFIGPGFATLLPTCYALAQFQSPQSALVVFACLTTAQFVIGELHRGEWPGTLSAYLRRLSFSLFSLDVPVRDIRRVHRRSHHHRRSFILHPVRLYAVDSGTAWKGAGGRRRMKAAELVLHEQLHQAPMRRDQAFR